MTARTEIITALVTQLKSDDVASGQVYDTRLYKVPDENLPAVFISVLSETVDYTQSTFSGGFIKQMRQLDIEIAIRAIGTDGEAVAATLDIVSSEVENSIYNNKNIGLSLFDFRYVSTAYDLNEDSSAPRGTATLAFMLLYQIQEPASSIII